MRVLRYGFFLLGIFVGAFDSVQAVIVPPELPLSKKPQEAKASIKPVQSQAMPILKNYIPILAKRDNHKNLYRIKFQWKEATKAAVFFYRDVGYLVFNRLGKLPPGTFPGDYVSSLKIIPHPTALIVRFTLKNESDVILTRMQDDWLLLIGAMDNEMPAHLYPFQENAASDSKSLSFTNDEAEPLIAFQDPETGDHFRVQPDTNRGMETHHEKFFLEVLPTYQGVVYLLKNPQSLIMNVDQKEHVTLVQLRSGSPLTSLSLNMLPREAADASSLMDLTKYDIAPESVFHVGRMMRLALTREKKPLAQFKKARELVKLYLATGQYHEAAGLLELLKQRHKNLFYKQDELILMYDLAQVLSHNIDDDHLLSNDGGFEGEPERDLLLAMHNQRFGRYSVALKGYLNAYKIIQNFPATLRNDVAIQAFEASVESHFNQPLFQGLIQKKLLTQRDQDAFKYYKAMTVRLLDPHTPLQDTYKHLTFSRNKRVALLARLALVDTKNKAKKSVVKDLESLMFTWRGDVLEQRFLADLAHLYQKAGQAQEALRCLRMITAYLWKFEKSHMYTKRAEDLFYTTFMSMKGQPFLTQIAYYYEFEDLVPRGKRYGKVMEHLTNLYMNAGLTDQAIQALNQHIKYLTFELKRFTLSEGQYRDLKNQTLKRIAELYLLSGNHAKVLTTLKGVILPEKALDQDKEQIAFSDAVHLLKALAYINRVEYQQALSSLNGLESITAKRLKADIYMAEKRWHDALPLLEGFLQGDQGKELSGDFNVDALLDLAVVASHLEDQGRVLALKKEYGQRIKDPHKRNAFNIIVSSPTTIDMSKSHIIQQLDVAERYGTLMEDIKKDILGTRWHAGLPKEPLRNTVKK